MLRALLEHRLRAAWTRRGPLAVLLWPLSRLYGALAARRRAADASNATRLPVPVIVAGNVVAGGAGKTPTTLAIVAHLRARGWRPGIVSRGHGRIGGDTREVLAHSDPAGVGDEPLLLRRRAGVPVFVAARRAEAGRALLAAHPGTDVLVCDDGLQHAALARDVEICVFDARGTGNGWLLPAGPLREPWPRAADLVLCTEPCPALSQPGATGAPAPVFSATRRLADHALGAGGGRVPLAGLRGQPLTAVAGIARPEAFFDMLRAAGLTLADTIALPDHYDFSSWPRLPDKRKGLICTEKDAPKLWRHDPAALAVPLLLNVPPAFFAALDERLAAQGYHPASP
ncbi:tetraacyldisaccharide 4'-kinase [Ottowia testudinis]|uniref:Tetraacyldisaccharide 4'-kinase n=1 Tax=Ottowia testudinis TaxID=2816950 RepID=A0A975CGK6_9BURK|nr:tetraacyldisaccharide 4'-kinase [Ottowia testudinis]QTD44711.1 tetraacyldisaccharide 4'-kinase [Ottowia testudinis]